VKLTATERRGLRAYKQNGGYHHSIHAKTLHALRRKGLIHERRLTPAGEAELAGEAEIIVPDIFDDLFVKKESMPKAKKKPSAIPAPGDEDRALPRTIIAMEGQAFRGEKALKRLRTVTDVEIDAHPLLDREQQKLCKIFRDKAAKDGDEFTMLDFAKLALRAAGKDYATASEYGHTELAVSRLRALDVLHRHAALLYTYEALKRGPEIVTETIEERDTLRDIKLLASHGGLP
jgi:hypothetical protein